MKKNILFLLLILSIQLSYAQQPFTAGNLAVVRIGDGEVVKDSQTALPVFIDEYTVTGQLVQSIALPTQGDGDNNKFTIALFDEVEGYLTISPNGKFLALGGYDAIPGTDTVAKTTSADVNRVVAIIDQNGQINTRTALGNAFNKGAIRSAIVNEESVWISGSRSGLYVAEIGAKAAKLITNTTGRVLSIANSQLYASSKAKTRTGEEIRFASIGTGLPVSGMNEMINLPGVDIENPIQAYFADLNPDVPGDDVLYLVDAREGLHKYSLVNGKWVSNGIPLKRQSYHSITGRVENGKVILFVTRKNIGSRNPGNGELVKIIDDSGYNKEFKVKLSPPIVVFDQASNKYMRGISFVPGTILNK